MFVFPLPRPILLAGLFWLVEVGVLLGQDEVVFELGRGQEAALFAQVALRWDLDRAVWESDRIHLGWSWELGFASWRWRSRTTGPFRGRRTSYDVSLTPILTAHSGPVYLELGTGPRFFSNFKRVERFVATSFEMGSMGGFGISGNRWRLGYRFMHISNAGLKHAQGVDVHSVLLAIRF